MHPMRASLTLPLSVASCRCYKENLYLLTTKSANGHETIYSESHLVLVDSKQTGQDHSIALSPRMMKSPHFLT